MSELLPIIFQKGVNEGVDIRVAPSDAHSVAENVRWRKDGRPAKRYGSALVDTSGFSAAYRSQCPNVIASWQGLPVLAIGSSIRSQSSVLGFAIPGGSDRELPHFGGAKHDYVCRSEPTNTDNPTSGLSKGVVLHVWEQGGAPALAFAIKNTAGAVIQPPSLLSGITESEPRCISTPNFIYLLRKQGTNLLLETFDPVLCAFTNSQSVGTLDAAGSHFDACGRTTDFLVSYQSAAAVVTTKLFTAINAPALVQTNATAVAVTLTRVGVVSDAASNIFVGVLEPSAGQMKVQVFNNGLTASVGVQILDTDLNNDSQPGLALQSTTTADVVWSGYVAASESSYFRYARMSGGAIISPARTFFGAGLASKPFVGPAQATIADIDATYVWVETSNRSLKWDSQRAYLLVKVLPGSAPPRPQLSLPNVAPSTTTRLHLADVLNMGVGFGFLNPLTNATRYGNGAAPGIGIDSINFRSIFESARRAARDTVTAGRALQIAGGALFEFVGVPSQTGFSSIPVIQQIVGGGGGGLTSPGSYLYRVCYEYIDNQGRRHRSAPSDPVAFATGANNSATLTLKPLVASGHAPIAAALTANAVVFHVYRTLAGQGTYHRVTPHAGAPSAVVTGTATVAYVDLMSDATAAVQELLYTDGGVVPNIQPPPGDFLTVVNGRVVVGGQPDRNVVTFSKLLVDGEPAQFSDEAEFSAFLPEDCTGVASIDGTTVLFSRERIYLVNGEGPNDQGIGAFTDPSELPTDVGCIDWRSIVETSIGVFFQSKRGIHLLPRGFGAPIFVGAEIQSTLTAVTKVIFSATRVSIPTGISGTGQLLLGESTARFVVGDENSGALCASYDLRTGGWSIDRRDQNIIDSYIALAGTWGDTFVYSTLDPVTFQFASVRAESPGSWDDGPDGPNPTFISSSLGTGDIRPFGVGGYGGFDRVVIVGEFRDVATVNVTVWVDGVPSQFAFNVTGPDTIAVEDGSVYLDVTPPNRLGTAIRVVVQDVPLAGTFPPPATEGFLVQAIFIEYDTIGKTKRLAQARKA